MENKYGLVGWIILGIIGFIVLIILIVGFYLYNFYVFETVRICIGDGKSTSYSCGDVDDCFDSANSLNVFEKIEDAPTIVKETFIEVSNRAVYCDNFCFIRNIRGIDLENRQVEKIESCNENEDEMIVNIRGKEALAIYNWIKNRDN